MASSEALAMYRLARFIKDTHRIVKNHLCFTHQSLGLRPLSRLGLSIKVVDTSINMAGLLPHDRVGWKPVHTDTFEAYNARALLSLGF